MSSLLQERYDRQTLIPGWDQDKIQKSTVCIWGVGALGTYISVTLALQGVGHLILIDYDSVEISNLNRQLLFQEEDVGKNKAEVAKEKLEKLNPNIQITAFPMKLQEVSPAVYQGVDVFIAGLDSFRARRWANSMAYQLKKPLVTGGMFSYLGNVQVIIPDETACFECQPLVPATKLAQACTPFGEERKAEHEDIGKPLEEEPIPSVATMSALIGSIMAQEATKLLLNLGKPLDNYLFIDGLHDSFLVLQLAKNPRCPICGEKYKLTEVKATLDPNEPVKDFIKRISMSYGLSEPQIIHKGIILKKDQTPAQANMQNNDLLIIIDKELATPIKLRVKLL